MGADETTFPMDVTDEDPSSRPWNFRPEGHLVAIICDIQEGRRAEAALTEAGFTSKDIKLYTGKQILNNQEVYIGRTRVTTKLVAWMFAEDVEGRELYLAYAGRPVRDVGAHPRRRPCCQSPPVLADFDCLHARYYDGHHEQRRLPHLLIGPRLSLGRPSAAGGPAFGLEVSQRPGDSGPWVHRGT